MKCNFDNNEMVCPVCGKRAPSRTARSNCIPTMTAEELQAMRDRFAEMTERSGRPTPQPTSGTGPGTELSKLLKRFGIEPTPTCACRAKANEMDAWGPDECSKPERIEEVVAVMREEAKARGLPFLDAAGRMLVKRAIANARRASSASLS
jgi:hypothetical protein